MQEKSRISRKPEPNSEDSQNPPPDGDSSRASRSGMAGEQRVGDMGEQLVKTRQELEKAIRTSRSLRAIARGPSRRRGDARSCLTWCAAMVRTSCSASAGMGNFRSCRRHARSFSVMFRKSSRDASFKNSSSVKIWNRYAVISRASCVAPSTRESFCIFGTASSACGPWKCTVALCPTRKRRSWRSWRSRDWYGRRRRPTGNNWPIRWLTS